MADTPWHPPSEREMSLMLGLLDPFYVLARPRFYGWEQIPVERPLLFVGNHTLYGLLDLPFLYSELWRQQGIFLRGLGDRAHFRIPGWSSFAARYGAVEGTREKCAELFAEKACVLVFPGGAREGTRLREERYKLVWQQRLGFAKMAMQHGVTIVPFSSIGVDDCFELLADTDELLASPLGPLLSRLRRDMVVPIPRHFHPERLYFRFAPPIHTTRFEGKTDDELAWQLRGEVAAAIEEGIQWLLRERESDPERHPGPEWRAEFQARLDSALARSAAELLERASVAARGVSQLLQLVGR